MNHFPPSTVLKTSRELCALIYLFLTFNQISTKNDLINYGVVLLSELIVVRFRFQHERFLLSVPSMNSFRYDSRIFC